MRYFKNITRHRVIIRDASTNDTRTITVGDVRFDQCVLELKDLYKPFLKKKKVVDGYKVRIGVNECGGDVKNSDYKNIKTFTLYGISVDVAGKILMDHLQSQEEDKILWADNTKK